MTGEFVSILEDLCISLYFRRGCRLLCRYRKERIRLLHNRYQPRVCRQCGHQTFCLLCKALRAMDLIVFSPWRFTFICIWTMLALFDSFRLQSISESGNQLYMSDSAGGCHKDQTPIVKQTDGSGTLTLSKQSTPSFRRVLTWYLFFKILI